MVDLLEITEAPGSFGADTRERAIEALEGGGIVVLPELTFELGADEQVFLDPAVVEQPRRHAGRARIIFEPGSRKLRKAKLDGEERGDLGAMVGRYAEWAHKLVADLFPDYGPALRLGPSTFRPCARARPQGLHVDSFFFVPTQGQRVLRLFTNVDPAGAPRVWQVGETFDPFARRFIAKVRREIPASGWLLERLRLTNGRRTAYDHAMRQLRNLAKHDAEFQRTAGRETIEFPSGTTWLVFTDGVLHGAVSGQFAFEQTFLLPVEAMRTPARAPLRILERMLGRRLA